MSDNSQKQNPAQQAPADVQWFKEGEEGFAEKEKLDALNKLRKEKGVRRFRIKTGEEHTIVFVDSKPCFIYEHNLWKNQTVNYITCLKEFGVYCGVCAETDDKAYYTAYLTVIDTTPYTKKDGTLSPFRKALFPAKASTIRRIQALVKSNGNNLTGLKVIVRRYGDTEPNCGSDFEVVGRVENLDKEFPNIEASKKYDYKKVLAPATAQELASLGISGFVHGSEEETNGDEEETVSVDDVMSQM